MMATWPGFPAGKTRSQGVSGAPKPRLHTEGSLEGPWATRSPQTQAAR